MKMRRSLFRLGRLYAASKNRSHARNGDVELKDLLLQEIKCRGPISVAQYMQRALACPRLGYYGHGEIFGERGDFVTSPEVSQLFGEMLALWCVQWVQEVCHDGPVSLAELGPGSGKLMSDLLRVVSRFPLGKRLNVHLVENSADLAKRQMALLSSCGQPISSHLMVEDLPDSFTVVIANEFFDALPVHKFKRVDGKWREVLIDSDDAGGLRFCLAPAVTLAQKAHLNEADAAGHDDWEVSPSSLAIMQRLVDKMTRFGGAIIIVDYGHYGDKGDTLRAFFRHKQVHPLERPGSCDLTADVNFRYFHQHLKADACIFGPISQRSFLSNLGIEFRLQQLLRAARTDEQRRYIQSSFQYLTNMGSSFHVLGVFPNVLEQYLKIKPPAGFTVHQR